MSRSVLSAKLDDIGRLSRRAVFAGALQDTKVDRRERVLQRNKEQRRRRKSASSE